MINGRCTDITEHISFLVNTTRNTKTAVKHCCRNVSSLGSFTVILMIFYLFVYSAIKFGTFWGNCFCFEDWTEVRFVLNYEVSFLNNRKKDCFLWNRSTETSSSNGIVMQPKTHHGMWCLGTRINIFFFFKNNGFGWVMYVQLVEEINAYIILL